MDYKIVQVSPDSLVPNEWNSNIVSPDNEQKLEESIKRFGMFKPVITRELPTGELQIIGGEHRAKMAKRLGYELIPAVNLGQISDKKAKEIGLVDNGRFGQDDSYKLSEVLASIGPIEEISTFMPYTEAELDSVFTNTSIALDELDELDLPSEDLEPPRDKALQTHQILRFKVPIHDVAEITKLIEQTIKQQGLDDSDSLTNAGDALVHILLKD